MKYLYKVKGLISHFLSSDVRQVSRATKATVNALLKLATSIPANLQKYTFFKVLKESNLEEPQIVQQINEDPDWIDPLLKYLKQGELSHDQKEARKIRHQASHYVLYEDKL